MRRFAVAGLAVILPAFLLAAGAQEKQGKGKRAPRVTKAVAVLHGVNSKVHGVVRFAQEGQMVKITGEITGLTPGEHAFHVHEFGDCSSPDAMSAGGHFNPTGSAHGGPQSEKRHVGDLGNITADADGKVKLDIEDKMIRLGGPNSILGRSLIVHEKADDLKSQPAGNAGARVACGVIGIGKP
jgi:Cu-Zn family superoxide dismutase